MEIPKYVTDSDLLMSGEGEQLDIWWIKVFKTCRCPVLSSLVRPCPSIFTGSMIECSFSMTNDIIDSRSRRMEIDTYSAIVTAKFNVKSSKKSAAVKYGRKGILRDNVNSELSYYYANVFYVTKKKRLKVKRGSKLSKRKNLALKKEFLKRTKKETGYYHVKYFFPLCLHFLLLLFVSTFYYCIIECKF